MRCSADEDAALCDGLRVGRATGWIGSTWHQLSQVAVPLRYALLGGAAAGALGGIIGLVIGLHVYAPTAWFGIVVDGCDRSALFQREHATAQRRREVQDSRR